jgi:hypothetical protein
VAEALDRHPVRSCRHTMDDTHASHRSDLMGLLVLHKGSTQYESN